MQHKTEIEHYDLQNLATAIGDLRYDALQDFLSLLSEKIKEDAAKDRARGRVKLATQLEEASLNLGKSAENIEKAWVICAPYM